MIVIFVKNDTYNQNENVIFVGCYDDMESCKQAITENATEYINKIELEITEITDEITEIQNDESYYIVFDTNTKEEKGKFFVHDFNFKVNIKVESI